VLKARNIIVNYGSRTAVADVSLELRPGEITAIIGPNGAGKSTLLRTLNGGLTPASGEVLLDERLLSSYSRRLIARRIAVSARVCIGRTLRVGQHNGLGLGDRA